MHNFIKVIQHSELSCRVNSFTNRVNIYQYKHKKKKLCRIDVV